MNGPTQCNAIVYGIFLLLSYHLREYFVENIFQLDFKSIVQRTVNQKVDRCVENKKKMAEPKNTSVGEKFVVLDSLFTQ